MLLGERVKTLREQRNLTQNEVADALSMSRPTYVLIESGKREVTVSELQRLSSVLGKPLEEVLFDTAQIATRDFALDKYKEVILNCLKYGADNDGKITKTKLAKLAYLADFGWFYRNLVPMTGLAYRRIQQGPVPDQYFRVIDELFEAGSINITPSGTAMMISANENPPTKLLNSAERKLIQEVGKAWKNKPTSEIVEFTHQQIPWKICRQGELIPYELITQEDPDHVIQPQL